MARFCIVLTRAAADVIRESTSWGYVTIGMSDADSTGVVRAVSDGDGNRHPVAVDNNHYLSVADPRPNCVWHRVPVEVNAQWVLNTAQQTMIAFEGFAELIPSGLRQPGDAAYYAITHVVDARDRYPGFPVPEFAAWHVSRSGVRPIDIDVEPCAQEPRCSNRTGPSPPSRGRGYSWSVRGASAVPRRLPSPRRGSGRSTCSTPTV